MFWGGVGWAGPSQPDFTLKSAGCGECLHAHSRNLRYNRTLPFRGQIFVNSSFRFCVRVWPQPITATLNSVVSSVLVFLCQLWAKFSSVWWSFSEKAGSYRTPLCPDERRATTPHLLMENKCFLSTHQPQSGPYLYIFVGWTHHDIRLALFQWSSKVNFLRLQTENTVTQLWSGTVREARLGVLTTMYISCRRYPYPTHSDATTKLARISGYDMHSVDLFLITCVWKRMLCWQNPAAKCREKKKTTLLADTSHCQVCKDGNRYTFCSRWGTYQCGEWRGEGADSSDGANRPHDSDGLHVAVRVVLHVNKDRKEDTGHTQHLAVQRPLQKK